MQPLYTDFCEAEEWGDLALYARGIDALYGFSLDGSTTAAAQILTETHHLFPDLDEFDNLLVSYAFDACVVLYEALLFVSTQQEAHFHSHLAAVTDCIDTFVQMYQELDPDEEDFNEILQADPYMRQEHERRERLLAALHPAADVTPATVAALKTLNGIYPMVALQRLAGL